MSQISTRLTAAGEEVDGALPFGHAQPSFSRVIMKMHDQFLDQKFQSWVLAARVDYVDVLGDVVDGEIFHRRIGCLRRIHGG